jgi:LETM1 and EF-hand domain-containing protein 1
MSLWLPRPSPGVLARSSLRHQLALRPHHARFALIYLARSHQPLLLNSRRSQSSKVSSTSLPTNLPNNPEPKPSPPATKEAQNVPLTTRVWKKIKHEAAHYWHGSKLLVSEVRIGARLQWKILQGESLTRRERRQVRICF